MGAAGLFSRLLGASAKPRVQLAAFGKHPGWDDHVEDLGIHSEALMAAKQFLYVQGIGGVIDSGAWETAPDAEAAPPFGHAFIWSGGNDLLAGRMWASSDGKNRTRYPMILCAQLEPASDQLLPWLFQRLAQWEEACRRAGTAEEVRAFLPAATAAAQAELEQNPISPPVMTGIFAGRLGLEAESEALARITYSFTSHFGAFVQGVVPRRETDLSLRLGQSKLLTQQLRVPADPGDTVGSLLFWRTVLREFIDPAVPQFFTAPLGQGWVDLIAGPLSLRQLVCLRASPVTLPLTSEVPFNLPEEAKVRALALAATLGFPKGKPAAAGSAG